VIEKFARVINRNTKGDLLTAFETSAGASDNGNIDWLVKFNKASPNMGRIIYAKHLENDGRHG
jgi:hypothetical protein